MRQLDLEGRDHGLFILEFAVETRVRSLGHEESLGEGNGYPPQYSRLENSIDRAARRTTVHRVAKSQT